MLRTRIVAAVAIAVGLTTMIAGPAQAHRDSYSTSFVDGGGAINDDWGDHDNELGGDLCQGCANSSNTDLVILWQSVLAAEGLLSHSGIDGSFGSGTKAATERWQERYGISSDGRVGPNTWDKADDRLTWTSTGVSLRYDGWGTSGKINFVRGNSAEGTPYGDGSYTMYSVGDDDNSDGTYFTGSHHIYLKSRSLTAN